MHVDALAMCTGSRRYELHFLLSCSRDQGDSRDWNTKQHRTTFYIGRMESEGGERGNDLSRELSAEQTTEQRGNSQSMELTMEGVVASRSGQVLLAHTLLKSDHFPGCQNLKLKPLIDGAPNFRNIDGLPVYVPTALGVNWSGNSLPRQAVTYLYTFQYEIVHVELHSVG